MFVGLPLIVDAFAFYTVRLTAAIIAYGSPERGVDILSDFKRNLQPITRLAAFLYPRCRQPQYSQLRNGISQLFIGTFMNLGLACQYVTIFRPLSHHLSTPQLLRTPSLCFLH